MNRILCLLFACLLPPAGSAGEDDGALEITPLAENVWLHTSYKHIAGYGWFPSNGLIVVKEGKALLIDTAWREQDTPRLLAWIEARGFELEGAFATHSHEDRTSGFAYLNQAGVVTYAAARTNALLALRAEPRARQDAETGLGGRAAERVEVFFPGAGHAPDNHVVWISDAGILFGGCLLRSAAAADLGNRADAEIEAWAKAVGRVRERYPQAKLVIPGHGAPGNAGLLEHTYALISRELNAGTR